MVPPVERMAMRRGEAERVMGEFMPDVSRRRLTPGQRPCAAPDLASKGVDHSKPPRRETARGLHVGSRPIAL